MVSSSITQKYEGKVSEKKVLKEGMSLIGSSNVLNPSCLAGTEEKTTRRKRDKYTAYIYYLPDRTQMIG